MKNVDIGDPLNRVDSRSKISGSARYAAEYMLPGACYAVLVTSTIPNGRIRSIETRAAERAPGVKAVITHLNAPAVPGYKNIPDKQSSRVPGQEFRVFYDDRIYFNHQPVAIAVADTLERANYAASLIKVNYLDEPHLTDLRSGIQKSVKPERSTDYQRGEPKAYQKAKVILEQDYVTPVQVHNPMETHACTVFWESDKQVLVYNKTQAVKLAQRDIMKAFGLKEENVKVISPYVGGAFGSSSRVWPQEMAALIAAWVIRKPVKLMLKRDQAFNMVGYRPGSLQKIALGASADGTLTGITHEAVGSTSTYEQFTERIVDPTKSLYKCPNLDTRYRLVPLNMSTPCWTRGPGESSGSFALESAIDELAYLLKIDPIALRIKNYAESDPENNKPWSSNHLKECFEQGAKRFGWSKRNPKPNSMRAGEMLVGMGMSAGIYKSERSEASISIKMNAEGNFILKTSMADVGPGSATIMTQIAADTLDMPMERLKFEWGNSSYPEAPGQFGSHTTVSVGSAVYEACNAFKQRLTELAAEKNGTSWKNIPLSELEIKEGLIFPKTDRSSSLSYPDVLKLHHLPELEITKGSKPANTEKFSGKSFCANFVEVEVHPLTCEVRIKRVVSAVDAGTIINHKTARSQVIGSVVWGIGMALMEEGIIDHRYGRYLNNDLAGYHLPVHADVPDIDVILIDKRDSLIGPLGAKGIGEIPLVGFTAAVANAVYHATGKRIRELPITPDRLI